MGMSESREIENLNDLIFSIKVLIGSMDLLDSAVLTGDEKLQRSALDALHFRLTAIAKLSEQIEFSASRNSLAAPADANSNSNSTNQQTDQAISQAISELVAPTPNAKTLHGLLDQPLESLRKMALSEILTLSLQ
jgi:hypothetical protein